MHPRAQVGLLNYLHGIAAQKQLTIIFSTHSVSLLKRVPRDKIIYLEANGGVVSSIKGCFPTYALGNIAYEEERGPDLVIYVEDEAALFATEALTQLAIIQKFKNDATLFPTVHVIPIGPFMSVVRFLDRSRALLPLSCTSVAFLDQDVKQETVEQWRKEKNHTALAEFQKHEQTIDYLPWTPEVAFIDFLKQNRLEAIKLIKKKFNNILLNYVDADIGDIPVKNGSEQRKLCKAAFQRVIAKIASGLPNETEADVRKGLIRLFAQWYWEKDSAKVLQLIGPQLTQAMKPK